MDSKIRAFYTPQILSAAAACFDVAVEELRELQAFENFIYEFNREGHGYILRITHISRRSPDLIAAEMQWIAFLHQNQVNCSLPLKSQTGKLVEVIGSGEARFVVCAFNKVPGQRLNPGLDTAQFRYNYGRQIGRMHRLTCGFEAGEARRPEWYEDDLVVNFELIVPEEQALVRERMRENTAQIKALELRKDNYGLVHFDAHPNNFFVQAEDIYLFDFDDSQYAYLAADIAIVLFYFAGFCPPERSQEDFLREFYKDFMQGYASQYSLTTEDLSRIPLFLKQRELMLYAAIMQAYQGSVYDGWAGWYMTGRKEKLEQGLPFLVFWP